jgi:aminoglycoside 6'-N-acetyltransferase I
MKVRKMAETDKPRWLELRRALWPECPAARHSLEMDQLRHSDGVVLLAEDLDGQVVGFAELSIRRDHVEGTSSTPVPYLEGWYVIPSRRRQGIGRALIESAEGWALEAGFWEMASDAESDNHDGIRAHWDSGFHEVGRSVHFVRPLRTPKAEPGTPPDGGPTVRSGDSGVTEGPPSVS